MGNWVDLNGTGIPVDKKHDCLTGPSTFIVEYLKWRHEFTTWVRSSTECFVAGFVFRLIVWCLRTAVKEVIRLVSGIEQYKLCCVSHEKDETRRHIECGGVGKIKF